MAIFEQRHYQATAEELGECYKAVSSENTTAIWLLAEGFAARFSSDNTNFSRERFLKACGMEDSS